MGENGLVMGLDFKNWVGYSYLWIKMWHQLENDMWLFKELKLIFLLGWRICLSPKINLNGIFRPKGGGGVFMSLFPIFWSNYSVCHLLLWQQIISPSILDGKHKISKSTHTKHVIFFKFFWYDIFYFITLMSYALWHLSNTW